MPLKIKELIIYYLLLPLTAIGSTKTDCGVGDRRNLLCKFPFNVNSTQKDFAVYFYPDDGGEEPLLDCAWIHSQLRCIKQKDIELKTPVSHFAEITIPRNFKDIIGSYRCVPEGHRHHTVKSCRFPEEREKDIFTACDANVITDAHQVIINCIFSLPVERFMVKKSTTVVGSFTKSGCQNSIACQYISNGEYEVFTLILDLDGNPYDEYFCHADQNSLQVDIKGCSLSSYKWNKNSSAPVLFRVQFSVAYVIMVAVAVGVLYR